jgi:hypothetical protein
VAISPLAALETVFAAIDVSIMKAGTASERDRRPLRRHRPPPAFQSSIDDTRKDGGAADLRDNVLCVSWMPVAAGPLAAAVRLGNASVPAGTPARRTPSCGRST